MENKMYRRMNLIDEVLRDLSKSEIAELRKQWDLTRRGFVDVSVVTGLVDEYSAGDLRISERYNSQ